MINRLTSPPMNVSKVYIPLMNSALHIQRVELPQAIDGMTFGRRVMTIWEIDGYDQYKEVAVWNPLTDKYESWFENSNLLKLIASKTGKSSETLQLELDKREKFLKRMIEDGIRDQKEVTEKILSYYTKRKNALMDADVDQTEKTVLNNFQDYIEYLEDPEEENNVSFLEESIKIDSNPRKK